MSKADRKPRGYWAEHVIIDELNTIVANIGHFPTKEDLYSMNRGDLVGAITRKGGNLKFEKLLGYEHAQKPEGYWTETIIINELQLVINKLNHFPLRDELYLIGKGDLGNAIKNHGGLNKFRELFGHERLYKPKGYWTDENIVIELEKIREEQGHFPTQNELFSLGRSDLEGAIAKHGGLNKFREQLGYEPPQKPDGYWTDERIITELRGIIDNIGHFPSRTELSEQGEEGLVGAITKHGGSNRFRKLIGYELIHKIRYWVDETIISELKLITDKIKHFPSQNELYNLGRSDILCAITKHGGFPKFRKLLGQTGLHERYLSESKQYYSKRGKNTEEFVKKIIQDWCRQNGYSDPFYNKKLAAHNRLEFVCELGKTIGIDVTNTKRPFGDSIRRKYIKKDYHKYVDELWIVVFSNVYTERDYKKFNEESPDNVKVMPIETFLAELDISTNEHLMSKIVAYNNCTFHTKDEFIKRHLNTQHILFSDSNKCELVG